MSATIEINFWSKISFTTQPAERIIVDPKANNKIIQKICEKSKCDFYNKKIEHWLLWIGGNIISIPLYFIKGLGFSGIQFTIFLGLAILGYIEWKKSLNKNLQTA